MDRRLALIITLFVSISGAPALADEDSCGERSPQPHSGFTQFAKTFVGKNSGACPDSAVGRIADSDSKGARYLKDIAKIGAFDEALQDDPKIKSFLKQDPRLKSEEAEDSTLRNCVTHGPTFTYLLGLDSGVDEGYDIGEHSANVLNIYLAQKKFYPEIDLKKLTDKSLNQMMLPILALHDIGKGIAVKAGDKELQHFYTSRFVKSYLKSANFTEKEINLAVALIDNDAIGDYLQGKVSIASARKTLQAQSKLSGLPYSDYMRLQKLFFTADASSYPGVRDTAFKKMKNGRLEIVDPTFAQLL